MTNSERITILESAFSHVGALIRLLELDAMRPAVTFDCASALTSVRDVLKYELRKARELEVIKTQAAG